MIRRYPTIENKDNAMGALIGGAIYAALFRVNSQGFLSLHNIASAFFYVILFTVIAFFLYK